MVYVLVLTRWAVSVQRAVGEAGNRAATTTGLFISAGRLVEGKASAEIDDLVVEVATQ
jgi:hypothetical protein